MKCEIIGCEREAEQEIESKSGITTLQVCDLENHEDYY